MTRPLVRLGVVGLGLAGRMVADALAADGRVAVLAGADTSPEARHAFTSRTEADVYAGVDDLLGDPRIDAVWVASPTRFHRPHVEAAVRAGKDVIVEKPMAASVADCDAMIAAAAGAGVWLLAGGVRSLDPAFAVMREVVASGAIGRLRHVSATAHTGWLRRERSAADLDEQLGGGVVFNQAPHQVDTIRLLAGGRPARSIRGATAAWSASRGDTGHFRAEIEFEGGITGVLAYDGHGYLHSAGLVAADGPPSPVLADAGLVIAAGSKGAVRPAGDHLQLVTDDGTRDVAVRPGNATTEAISELLVARSTGVPPLHTGDWGRDTLEIVAALLESARRGTPVQFAAREERNAVYERVDSEHGQAS